MCDEMLQLIKDGIDQPEEEQDKEQEKQDVSDNEGFNDERDNDWEEAKQAVAKPGNKKQAQKLRLDASLTTVAEESEPENTFKNTL